MSCCMCPKASSKILINSFKLCLEHGENNSFLIVGNEVNVKYEMSYMYEKSYHRKIEA